MEAVRPVRSGLTATLTALAVIALVGCSPATPSSSSTTSPATGLTSTAATSTSTTATTASTTAASSAPATPSGSTGAASASAAAARPCRTSQLTASLGTGTGAAAGHVYPFLVLTNKAATACTVTGYPGVSFVGDGNGTQLGAAATREPCRSPRSRLLPVPPRMRS